MERRRALVVAGTMTATLAMAGTAMAVNMGLLGTANDPVGDLTATEIQPTSGRASDRPAAERQPRVRVIVQDIPVATGGGSGSGAAESDDDSAPAAAPAPPAPDGDDDDGYDSGYDDDDDDGGDDDSIDEPDDD